VPKKQNIALHRSLGKTNVTQQMPVCRLSTVVK